MATGVTRRKHSSGKHFRKKVGYRASDRTAVTNSNKGSRFAKRHDPMQKA